MDSLKQSIPRRISIQFDVFHRLKFMDRVRILVGYNIVCRVVVNVDKRTGQAFQSCQIGLTNAVNEQQIIQGQQVASLQAPEESAPK